MVSEMIYVFQFFFPLECKFWCLTPKKKYKNIYFHDILIFVILEFMSIFFIEKQFIYI